MTPADQDARERIRTEFASTLFVEAGAGTGKTFALVTRVVHMVATGHLAAMSGLAAITFTENAASELRSRIRAGLGEAAAGMHADVRYDRGQQDRCRRGLADLEDAVLTTLHGFAARILGETALEAGLPPGFSVEAGGGGQDADRAWDDFVSCLLDDPEVREHILAGLTLGLNLAELRAAATALGGSWDRLTGRPLAATPIPPMDAAEVLTHLDTALADADRWPADALAAHLRGEVTDTLDELRGRTHPLDLLETLAGADLECSRGLAPDWRAAGLDKAVVVAALKQAQLACRQIVSAVGVAVTATLGERVQAWVLDEAARRRDAGALDYHDLLVLARDVLRADPAVRRRLHEAWPTLLIDEFQDTDPLQVEIACLLAGECDEVAPARWQDIAIAGPRLFFVGDAKQSIYRFRRADIDIFTAVGRRHANAALRVNFRSVPGVLDAVNAAFGELIGADPDAGIPYAPLEPHRASTGSGQGPAPAPVLLLGGPQPKTDAASLREVEAAHLADVAVRAKREGWQVGHGQPRAAAYRDMAILLPTRTSLPALEKALQARSVPYRIESRSLVWSTDAVRGVVAILAAVDNPADEVALLAALRNPGLACSDADLVGWRAAGGRWSLFARPPEGLAAEHPVPAALATLRAWHEARWWLPANELVERVVRELRLVELTASQRRPRDHWRRLRFVVDAARAWADGGGSGLSGFVAWAMGQMEDDADVLETVVPEPDDDAVRILTVHGSKGLEFPITMIAGLAGGFGRPPKVLWTDAGPEIRLRAGVLETAGWDPALRVDGAQARREEIRLLYVALTRAMDHLVLGCYHCPPKNPASRKTSAQRLWDSLAGTPLVATEAAAGPPVDTAAPALVDAGEPLPDRGAFGVERGALLAAVAARVATSPTARTAAALADLAPGEPPDAPPDEPSDEPADEAAEPDKAAAETAPEPDAGDGNPAARPVRPRRGTRLGAAIGTATHRVLELADLADPDAAQIRALARMACAQAQIPELVADVEARAWAALRSDAVRGALAAGGRACSEVYLVVPDGDRFLEGYIDLLITDAAGDIAVLDYKTDRARTPAEVAAKQAHYAPQLAAYAAAIAAVTGRGPTSAELVFARPEGLSEALSDGPSDAPAQASP